MPRLTGEIGTEFVVVPLDECVAIEKAALGEALAIVAVTLEVAFELCECEIVRLEGEEFEPSPMAGDKGGIARL
jgi:hypothetical protein